MRWIDFEDGIEHIFPGAGRTPAGDLPPDQSKITLTGDGHGLAGLADYVPAADFIGAYDEAIPSRHGLPFVFMQGYRPFAPALEDLAFRSPCPKICVSKWLYAIGRQKDVPAEQLFYAPNGLRHDKYRLTSPIEKRPQLVSSAYHDHPQKGTDENIAVLEELKHRLGNVDVTVFSQIPPRHETPGG